MTCFDCLRVQSSQKKMTPPNHSKKQIVFTKDVTYYLFGIYSVSRLFIKKEYCKTQSTYISGVYKKTNGHFRPLVYLDKIKITYLFYQKQRNERSVSDAVANQ